MSTSLKCGYFPLLRLWMKLHCISNGVMIFESEYCNFEAHYKTIKWINSIIGLYCDGYAKKVQEDILKNLICVMPNLQSFPFNRPNL
jgi:hypothetical protein